MSAPAGTLASSALAARTRARPREDERAERRSDLGPTLLCAVSATAIVGACLVIVALAAHAASFLSPTATAQRYPSWMSGPLSGLWPGAAPSGHELQWLVCGLLGLTFAAWVLVVLTASRVRPAWIIGAVVLAELILLLGPPMQYTDVFNYINYGRMGVLHHLDPYTTLPIHGPHSDPAFAISNWHHLRSPYGPLFTLFTYALVPLGVPASMWTVKVLMVVLTSGVLALVWRLARHFGRPPALAVAFVGLNPIVLIWGLGGVHIDVLMTLCALGAVSLLLAPPQRLPSWTPPEALAGVLLVAAVGVKASAVLFLPLAIAIAPRRRPLLIGLVGAGVVLGAATLAAFGPHLGGLRAQSKLVSPEGLPNLFGLIVGQGGDTTKLEDLITLAAGVVVLLAAVRAWRSPRTVMACGCAATCAVIFSLGWSAPWYVIWALPFAALAPARRWRVLLIVYTIYALVASCPTVFQIEHALHFLPRNGTLGAAHVRYFDALAAQ
ncbi:MAG TPA: glycosyltransferase family 87 protein [Solirubrobacteraceae bacterium]|nr:glycosyltransferase family 87 protein [Solirubrobacteraceae bacterium]